MVLPAELKRSFNEQIETFEQQRAMPYVTSIERDAMQKRGHTLLTSQLTHRFGELSGEIAGKLSGLTTEQQERLSEALLDFHSVADLEQWLARE